VIATNRNQPLCQFGRFWFIGFIASIFLITSCISHQKYPSSWGKLIPVDENKCPDISGRYSNSGEDPMGNKNLLLSDLFDVYDIGGGGRGRRYLFYRDVEIKQLDGAIEFSGSGKREVMSKKLYPKSEYSCTSEGIRIPYKIGLRRYDEMVGLIGGASGLSYLSKSIDGFLVIKVTGSAFQMELGVPWVSSGTSWYRFPERRSFKLNHVAASRAEGYVKSAGTYFSEGQYDLAISDYNLALGIHPRLVDAYIGRGLAYVQKGEYDFAISDYNIALEISPNNPLAYNNRGRAYYLKGDYDKSWEDFEKAQELGYEVPPEFLDELRKASGRQN
jgi:tetratricopeptide (TPR) repeat protein